jgi:hypothetical protein
MKGASRSIGRVHASIDGGVMETYVLLGVGLTIGLGIAIWGIVQLR